MTLNSTKAIELWDAFLDRWPLEKLDEILVLDTYTQVKGDKQSGDSFTYWLEQKTEEMGSIGGGSSFKFGIFHRGKNDAKTNGKGRIYGEKYAWYSKYDPENTGSAEAAFSSVKKEVLTVARAARNGHLDIVEKASLGPAVKWKIAFIYQDRQEPILLPIFKQLVLRALTGMPEASYPALYEKLNSDRGQAPLFSYSEGMWQKGQRILASQITHETALHFLQDRLATIGDKEPTKYMAGFQTEDGRQVGLVRRGKEVTLFAEPGDWERLIPNLIIRKTYLANEPRINSLEANAPRLSVGNAAHHIDIPSLAALSEFCDAYEGNESALSNGIAPNASYSTSIQQHRISFMNKILYGPPGTGKTFKTAQIAVEICNGEAPTEREKLMARYEELRKEGRIRFVTFHQSYGYEDFVEGLRPEMKDGQITYRVRPGIFRDACDAARLSTLVKPGLSGEALRNRRIYKMSLGVAGTAEGKQVFQACMEQGLVLLGWGGNVDFSDCTGQDEILKIAKEAGNLEKPEQAARYIGVFRNELQIGDIIIASNGNAAFRAIGEVVGNYEFVEAAVAGHFHQKRSVKWLAVFEAQRAVSDIYNRNFMQSTLYTLDPAAVKFDALEELLGEQQEATNQPYVLIVDEINRANISKVFGELITLLEPDKREGKLNAVTVKLPYSGDDFSVPSNLHIIGTMNTADRSIALLDTALRRRFDFDELQPDYNALSEADVDGVSLRQLLEAINSRIEYLYDRDHTIGHAYFIDVTTLTELNLVFRRKVIPLLQEYFYENWEKVKAVLNDKDGDFIQVETNIPNGLESFVDTYETKSRYRVNATSFSAIAFQKIYAA